MDALKREMERKRKLLQETKKNSGGKRYLKASERKRFEESSTQNDQAKKRKEGNEHSEEQIDESPVNPVQEKAATNLLSNDQKSIIPTSSLERIQSELRALQLPISLFGETLQDRLDRLETARRRQSESKLHQKEADEFRLDQGHGIRNPFLEKESTENSIDALEIAPPKPSSLSHVKNIEREEDNVDEGDTDDPYKQVYRHFKGLLRKWEASLNERSEADKRSLSGRNETKTLKQCKDYIRPLFRLLKARQLEENLLNKLDEMVKFCKAGEFVRANDQYLDVAIGRAAWPIGVTMVGIHARTGRAKIESSNVAHVMNSELQRKYLTSVKRLLTYEQSIRTDVDPSKKVVN